MTIHREGRTLLFFLLLILLGLNWIIAHFFPDYLVLQNAFILASIVFYLAILQFFRNPIFPISKNEQHVLAPADGKIVVIEETTEPEYFNDRRIQISIFMSPFNVHVNRSPVSGIVSFFAYHPGKYLVAWHPKSSIENERTTVVLRMKDGVEILFRQIAGAVARRIKCYAQKNQPIAQGDEFGFIKFGSRVDIFLPLSAKITVNIGDITKGGKTILARF